MEVIIALMITFLPLQLFAWLAMKKEADKNKETLERALRVISILAVSRRNR